MTISDSPPDRSGVETARLLLAHLGVSPDQLMEVDPSPTKMPTVADYLDAVVAGAPAGVRRVYHPYWQRVREEWGPRLLTEPTAVHVQALAEIAKKRAVLRRNSRGGRSAAEHMIAALRYMYGCAVADGLLDQADNPAAHVRKPRRLASTRRALLGEQLRQIHETAGSTGDDPGLDSLLLRLHGETACRRGAALRLRSTDLDPAQCLIQLREKGEVVQWQPVSPSLMTALQSHQDERVLYDNPEEKLLRYRHGRPITYRRYDYLWNRLGRHLSWVATQQVTTHWLRHATLTWVERHFGYAVARAYAGHNGRNDAGTTATYIRADLYEVARALAALTGEPHPLAP